MPRSTRWKIKQKLDTVNNELSKAYEKLAEAGNPYEEHHPDIYKKFGKAAVAITVAIDWVEHLQEEEILQRRQDGDDHIE